MGEALQSPGFLETGSCLLPSARSQRGSPPWARPGVQASSWPRGPGTPSSCPPAWGRRAGALIRCHSPLTSSFSLSQGQEWDPGVGRKEGFLPDQEISDSVRDFSVVWRAGITLSSLRTGWSVCACVYVVREVAGGRKEAGRRKSQYQETRC